MALTPSVIPSQSNPLWIIDEGPLDVSAQHLPIACISSWSAIRLAIPEEASLNLRSSSRRQAFVTALQQTGVLSILTFGIGDPAEDILRTHFRKPGSSPTANLAEHQAIAWMLANPAEDTVLVLSDKRAIPRALAELGRGHVAHVFEWWDALLAGNLIVAQQHDQLCETQRKKDQTLPRPWRHNS